MRLARRAARHGATCDAWSHAVSASLRMRRKARCHQSSFRPTHGWVVAMRNLAPAASNRIAQLAQIAAVDLSRLYYELLESL
jgi:hypothetical protein